MTDITTLTKKWENILESDLFPRINDEERRKATAMVLENTVNALEKGEIQNSAKVLGENALNEQDIQEVAANNTTNVQNFDPVLIGMVRRSVPNLIAYDLVGVQPMKGPVSLIFAMRAKYGDKTGPEAFYNEPDTTYSGTGTAAAAPGTDPGTDATTGVPLTPDATPGTGVPTATMEANTLIKEMSFTIEKLSVEAKSRALKAEYTTELVQDLRAIHGLDAEKELIKILSTELVAEQNREIIRWVYTIAKTGSPAGTVDTEGWFDLVADSNGRWAGERFKGMYFHIQREANAVARETRRGKGNVLLCSSDVAAALHAAGMLDYAPELKAKLAINDAGNTFAGVLPGGMKVFIDPYAAGDYFVVGYKGTNSWDAGLYFCPYVPLELMKAKNQDDFQPKVGFKTRYGLVANPFAEGTNAGLGALNPNSNVYYRRTLVKNIM